MIAITSPRKEFGTRAEARTKEIERALKLGAEYIFMIDSDQTIPDDGFQRLQMCLEDADIAVIDAPDKFGNAPSNIRYNPDGTIAYATISCCLMRADIFEKIEKPWFSSKYSFIEKGVVDGKIKWNIQEKYQDDNVGEDIYFMYKAMKAGLKVIVIPDLKCVHKEINEG